MAVGGSTISAGMGGAVLNGIFNFGIEGLGVFGTATAPVLPGLTRGFKGLFRGRETPVSDMDRPDAHSIPSQPPVTPPWADYLTKLAC